MESRSQNTSPLHQPVQFLKGVGPKIAQLLSKKGIETLEDALYFLPREYQDRRNLTTIEKAALHEKVVLRATVTSKTQSFGGGYHPRNRYQKKKAQKLKVTVSDGTGNLQLQWFHAYPSIQKDFEVGQEVLLFGEITQFGALKQISHPQYEVLEKEPKHSSSEQALTRSTFESIVPIYSESEGLHQRTIRRLIEQAVDLSKAHLEDPLPLSIRQRLDLCPLEECFIQIHYPTELPEEGRLPPALRRLIFEEFFILHLGLELRKRDRKKQRAPVITDSQNVLEKFLTQLPFSLTPDQLQVIEDIQRDFTQGSPMTRLVQGDVGSGKTVVAFAAAALSASAGYQTALMVPTEVLAQQHLKNARKWLDPLGIRTALLVGSDKKEGLLATQKGEADFVIGTHALFQSQVEFKNLGLTIFDEQHRFGVEQRHDLVKKSQLKNPHVLMMTATPIPRTLSMTLYGDLDLSFIRTKPTGRIPVVTKVLFEKNRQGIYQGIRNRVQMGQQVFIIYPLVEDSDKLELKSATQMYEHLSSSVFPQLRVALLHGKMKSDEKNLILKQFKAHEFDILVSTTVIEVGIDIPNATLMIIEHPERLGLSQLHQLRGRVGRGSQMSHCILLAQTRMTRRLQVMVRTEDGFKIAEEDLNIRGPGEFLGTRQSGLPGFRVGHILRDSLLLEASQREARALIEQDPYLELPQNKKLKKMVEERWSKKIERLRGT